MIMSPESAPSCYTLDAIQGALAHVSFALVMGAFLACFIGGFAGRATWYFLHHFVLRRLPAWRRFQRALDRVFAA